MQALGRVASAGGVGVSSAGARGRACTHTLVEPSLLASMSHVDMAILNGADTAEIIHLALNLFDRVFQLLHVTQGNIPFILHGRFLLHQHSKVVLKDGALHLVLHQHFPLVVHQRVVHLLSQRVVVVHLGRGREIWQEGRWRG